MMRLLPVSILCAAACAQAAETIVTYLSAQSQAPALEMEIIKPSGPGPTPVVLLIHGGAFEKGSPEDMRPIAEQLLRSGFASALVSYRMAPRFQFPAQVQDLKAAVRFLRANAAKLSVDTSRICAVGNESGATLALLLGFTRDLANFEGRPEYREFSSVIDCVVSRDMLADVPASWAGETGSSKANPLQWITPHAAPALFLTGKARSAEAARFADRLRMAGVKTSVVMASGAELPSAAVDFLRQELKPAPDQWTVLLCDHGPAANLVAMGWPSGKVRWKVPTGAGLDVQALADGHVLYTNHSAHKVVEIDSRQKEVWSLGAEAGLATPFSVRRLENGNTLVGDAKGARVFEFTPKGSVAWKWEKPEMADLWPRMSRPTPTGTILVTFQKAGAVFEVDRQGTTVWQYKVDPSRLPYQALRLANGNTVIGLVDPGEVIEVDRKGNRVRSIGGPDGRLRFGWIAGVALLPSGGMMIADFTSHRVVEVDAAGNLVHEIRELPWAIASIAVMPAQH
jgi:hypothetical protein